MRAANRFSLTRFADHAVLRFGMSESEDPEDFGELVEELFVPLTTTTKMAMKLWEHIIRSTGELTAFFTSIQEPMANLNKLSAETSVKNDRKPSKTPSGEG